MTPAQLHLMHVLARVLIKTASPEDQDAIKGAVLRCASEKPKGAPFFNPAGDVLAVLNAAESSDRCTGNGECKGHPSNCMSHPHDSGCTQVAP